MNKNLTEILKGKIVLVGLGNIFRCDDGLGPELIHRLKGQVNASCIDAGIAMESYLGKVIKEDPDTILLVDAVHLGLLPGQYRVLGEDDILKTGMTTHDLSPKFFIQYLKDQTKAQIYLLGVQPRCVELGEEISSPVRQVLTELETQFKEILKP